MPRSLQPAKTTRSSKNKSVPIRIADWDCKVRVAEVVERAGDSREVGYLYDMGDGWEHRLVFERDEPATYIDSLLLPLCVAGENACPPEDVGGPPGYAEFLEAISEAGHPEHVSMLRWAGGAFDPKGFDLNRINAGWRHR